MYSEKVSSTLHVREEGIDRVLLKACSAVATNEKSEKIYGY